MLLVESQRILLYRLGNFISSETSPASINIGEISCSDCRKSIPVRDENVHLDCAGFKLQSGIVKEKTTIESKLETDGLVSFTAETEGQEIDITTDVTTESVDYSINADLSKFLSRPVNINSYEWTVGGGTDFSLKPWSLFLNHPSIKKKIDNYYLFRGDLHVKVVINASPFYYGCCMVAYSPLEQYHRKTIGVTGVPNILYSQLPRIFVYPQNSQGGTLKLPFFYQKEWVNLSSLSDIQNLGELHFRFMSILSNANGATNPITIQTYAWMENIELHGPTSSLALQSGKDEYGKTIISDTASAIARSMGMLSKVPVIGPFATGTSVIASAIGTVARHFGYTNVPVITPPSNFMPQTLPNYASTDIGTPIQKLTLDSKNELTIDPKTIGLDFGDELEISKIVGRESYIDGTIWSASDPVDDLLYNFRVNPAMCTVTADGASQNIVNGTPMWMVSRLFGQWRGDIEFRFKIICSQYHRGRLRFTWDPAGNASTTNATTEAYTRIVDIAEESDIIIRVPYMQQTAFLGCYNILPSLKGASALTPSSEFDNGVLTVRVLTELTSPIDSASVQILMFVRGCDNLEFGIPVNPAETLALSPYTVQSGILNYDEDETKNESIAMKPTYTPNNINLLYAGETISSLRTLLRRANLARTFVANASSVNTLYTQIHRSIFSRLPLYPGYDPNGVNSATGLVSGTTKPYNFVPYTSIAWIGQNFIGCRGSVFWYVNAVNPSIVGQLNLTRNPAPNSITLNVNNYNVSASTASTNNAVARSVALFSGSGHAGQSVTNARIQTSVNASIPYYSKYKFRNYAPLYATLGTSFDDTDHDLAVIDCISSPANLLTANTQAMNSNQFITSCSIGTDFSFLFFLCVPVIYQYASQPVAA